YGLIAAATDSPITVTNYAVGQYVVALPDAAGQVVLQGGTTSSGNVQVTAFGTNGERCKVQSFSSNDQITMDVYVACYSADGSPANSRFTLQYNFRPDTLGPEGAYLQWTPQPDSPHTFVPDGVTTWNSTGSAISVAHSPGTGLYYVTMSGQNGGTYYLSDGTCAPENGIVQVTALGSDNDYCNISSYSPGLQFGVTDVTVQCFNGYTGSLSDSAFLLNYSTMSPGGTRSAALAFAYYNTAQVSQYTLVPMWSQELVDTSDGNVYAVCDTTSRIVTRTSIGHTTVTFGGPKDIGVLFDPFGGPSSPEVTQSVQVTAFDPLSAGLNCETTGWYTDSANNVNINVACYDATGASEDVNYMIGFSSNWADEHF